MMIYSRYNPPVADGVDFTGHLTKTIQSAKDECDINKILERFAINGVTLEMSQALSPKGFYGDFTQVLDYRSSIDAVNTAKTAFMALPSNIRARFDNDPGKLLDFLANDANKEEAIALGFIPKPMPLPADVTAGATPEPEKAV